MTNLYPHTAALVAACVRGHQRAHQALYESYLPYVLTVVRRFGVTEAHCPDVVQDIFVEVFLGLTRFDASKGELRHWIRGIAVHKIVEHQKKDKRLPLQELNANYEIGPTAHIDLGHLDTEYLLTLIGQLPLGYRTVFNLYVVDGYTHEEIADMLGISAVGARSQLSRAKAMLRDLLGSSKKKTTYEGQ